MSISVDVHLLSGKRASLDVEADASVESLTQRAQLALGTGKGRLLNAAGEVLDRAATIHEARLQSGDVLTLHVKQVQLAATGAKTEEVHDNDGLEVYWAAFAALLGDGSVVTWGRPESGGDSSAVQEQLKDVQQIQASSSAFAAVLGDGSVVAWGEHDYGGDSSGVQQQLQNVQQIQACYGAFAAILGDGSVVTWGDRDAGGDSSAVQEQLKHVQQIQASNDGAFAAILHDGSVVTWGDRGCGGDSSAVQDQLRCVQQIQASCQAIAAILSDGSVVTWGDPDHGGDSRAVQQQLRNVQKIQASNRAFAAVLRDGSVVAWGDPEFGGDCSGVQQHLLDVQHIQASCGAFAAILGDGSVVTWGDSWYGGSSSAVQVQLNDVQQIQAASCAFAAITGDGSVVTWGDPGDGGDSSAVQEQLKDVQQIQSSNFAFAAILGDGSVVSWGDSGFGGDSTAIQQHMINVRRIQASGGALAAILNDGSVLSWGVHFFDAKNLSLAKDVEVTFGLKYIADGSAQAFQHAEIDLRPVELHKTLIKDCSSRQPPFAFSDKAVDVSLCEESLEPVILKVKSFNDQRGFGFVKVTGSGMDLYFHDLDDASQGLLMRPQTYDAANVMMMIMMMQDYWAFVVLGEAGLVESSFPEARPVAALQALAFVFVLALFFWRRLGVEGFINCTGNPVDIYFQGDVGHDAQKRCEEMGVGTVVWFTVYAQTESRWQAREIVLAGDGSSPGGITPDMLGPKGRAGNRSKAITKYSTSDIVETLANLFDLSLCTEWRPMDYGDYGGKGWGKGPPPKVEKQVIPGCELVGRIKSYNADTGLKYFQIWDLTEAVKQQLESVGPDGSGITSGALVHFWLQLMPFAEELCIPTLAMTALHGIVFRVSSIINQPGSKVDAAVQKAAQVAHEAIIPGTGTLLYDGAEVSGTIRTFNKAIPLGLSKGCFDDTQKTHLQDRGYGFVNVDCDETDLYFHVKALELWMVFDVSLPEPARVWFWAEMLDNGMTGRWRCHDLRQEDIFEVSMTFKRGGQGEVPPAKRQRTEGPGGPGGPNVNGTQLGSPSRRLRSTRVLASLVVSRSLDRFIPGSRTDDRRMSDGGQFPQQPVARTLSSALRQMSWNFNSRPDESNPSCFACTANKPNCSLM
ncbi:putative E3 ubiquitin-protein ligase HERC2 [Symbiodinium microadriaticum]|uniref:Putative E3 ubiquitin-protein ligase HERC2 n=1 Tax=Symbiodinium microadriaticum TaxID=2951 RepID=A0A1Q9C685_SYMMI|nr:putative E3 ubiquitin-protein ligase HERC2 [Symbiodinium microadriaticum]